MTTSVFEDKIGMARFVPYPITYPGAITRSSPVGYPEILEYWRFVPFHEFPEQNYVWWQWRDALVEPVERDWTKVRFLWNNLWDQATLTASSEQPEFWANRTQHRWVHWHWRTTVGGEQTLVADLGSAQDVKAFILNFHWWLPNADIRIQANTSDIWTSPPVDVSLEVTHPEYPLVKFWDSVQSYRYWRLYIDTDDETGVAIRGDKDQCPYCTYHHRVGRIFLGDYWEPEANVSKKIVKAFAEDGEKFTSLPGQIRAIPEPQYRKIQYSLEWLSDSDRESLEGIFEDRGRGGEFWICENEKFWWKKTYYVTMSNDLEIESISKTDKDLYSAQVLAETMR